MLSSWARWALCAAPLCFALKPLDSSKACNGDPGLCHLSVDQVTFSGTHNADAKNLKLKFAALGCLTDNHENMIVSELNVGLRFFDIDTCMMADGTLRICHGVAIGIKFRPELERVKDWVVKNPNEVIVISYVNSDPFEKSLIGKDKLMERITNDTREVFGDLMYTPPMLGGVITGGWPKLGDLVAQNTRVIVLWGQKLYYHIFRKDKNVSGFRNQHIWMEKYWAETYGGGYTSMYPNQLGDYLEHFCDDSQDKKRFEKGQSMILADAYLTISAKRGPFSICNKDLAGDVNPVLLNYKNMHTNPIVQMQSNCWKKQKQVSLLSMDYTMYFPYHLDRMARKLNERNFVEYGWVGGKMTVSGAQAQKTEADLKALIAKLGGVDPGRITVEKKDTVATARLLQGNRSRRMADLVSGSATVHFSILAPAIHPLMDPSNTEVLAKVKEAAKAEAEVHSVSAVCRDPGIPASGARTPAALQESFDEGAELTFTCSPPKSAMHGTAKRICGPDGLFDGIQPNCAEEWTKQVRLMPFWAKVLLVMLLCLCILGCLGGCILLCVKKCMSRRYSKIQDES